MRNKSLKKTLVGTIVGDKMNKVRTVEVETHKIHPIYKKVMVSYKKYKAADAENKTKTGDTVKMIESRPLSKDTRWKITQLIERAKE